jgi:hypothetical protein
MPFPCVKPHIIFRPIIHFSFELCDRTFGLLATAVAFEDIFASLNGAGGVCAEAQGAGGRGQGPALRLWGGTSDQVHGVQGEGSILVKKLIFPSFLTIS